MLPPHAAPPFRSSVFGFVSDFGLRVSVLVVLGAWLARGLIALGIAAPAAAATVADPPAPKVLVHTDGSVVVSTTPVSPARTNGADVLRQFSFGLPGTPPTRRELEDGGLPIGRTQWEKDGIRYTQIVLLTRLESGELLSVGKLTDDAVLLVHVLGENTASEYSEATAEFSMRLGGEARELALREDRVCEIGAPGALPLAVVDIPPTGMGVTRGPALRFRGSMPPGTSGSMTLKIPVNPLNGDAALSRLRELEFDEAFRRVKRFWTDRIKAGASDPLPLALAESGSPPTARQPGTASDTGRAAKP